MKITNSLAILAGATLLFASAGQSKAQYQPVGDDGIAASPLGGALPAAIEFAFDSNVCSFGFSTDSFDFSVSTNGGFFGTVGAGARSTIVSSSGFSSSTTGEEARVPKAARE